MKNIKYVKEWFNQAKYDIETAEVMLKARRYIYCIFMCHLSIEKSLKALYTEYLEKVPPKVHSLVYLAKSTGIDFPDNFKDFLEGLDEISVPARYPEELNKVLKEYDKVRTEIIFNKSKELLRWLKTKSKKQ